MARLIHTKLFMDLLGIAMRKVVREAIINDGKALRGFAAR